MIAEHHWEVRELRDMLVPYASSPYAGREAKRAIARIKTVANRIPTKKVELYLSKVGEVAEALDVLYDGTVGYRKLHVSSDTEKTLVIDTDRLKSVRALGLSPIFEKLDEEEVREKFISPSNDPVAVLQKAVKRMEPLLMEYGDGCYIVAAVKDLGASVPYYTLEPQGKLVKYYYDYADGEVYGKAFVDKLIRLRHLVETECKSLGITRDVLPLNPDSGTEALVVCEYLKEETDRLRELYCKLIAFHLTRMI